MNGYGVYTFSDKSKYEGIIYFKLYFYHVAKKKIKKIGNWKDNFMNGSGKMFYVTGTVYEGL